MSTNKNTLQEVWNTLRKSWQVFIVVISFLIGLGMIQIDVISVRIPPTWTVPFIMAVVLLGSLIALAISLAKIGRLERTILATQAKIGQIQNNAPMLFIEGVPIQGLIAHIFKRAGKSENQVHLDILEVSVTIQGVGLKRDAAMRWRLSGTNSTNTVLTNLHLSIAGETLTPLNELACAVYDLSKDPSRKSKILPILIDENSTNKNVLLPFMSPGVRPYEHFDLELSYLWPSIVNVRKDYWFVDPINYALSVDRVRFQIDSADPIMKAAYAFQLDVGTRRAEFQGSVPIEMAGDRQKIVYEVECPQPEVFYVLIVEGDVDK